MRSSKYIQKSSDLSLNVNLFLVTSPKVGKPRLRHVLEASTMTPCLGLSVFWKLLQ